MEGRETRSPGAAAAEECDVDKWGESRFGCLESIDYF